MSAPAANTKPENQPRELAPLTWVLPDLRKSFPMAVSALRHFSLNAKDLQPAEVDLSSGVLRDVSRQFRQSRIALDIVGQEGVAIIIAALENLIEVFAENPAACTENAIQCIENATRGIIEFLEAVLKGRAASEVGLFPQYRELALLTNSPRIHPADLWCVNWKWRELKFSTPVSKTPAIPRLKLKMDDALLRFLNSGDLQAATELALHCAGLARASEELSGSTFWSIAAGFFEASANSLLPVDVYVKRAASQILQQLSALSQDARPSERVAQDVAFFVLRASATDMEHLPFFKEVRRVYADIEVFRGDYNELHYGRIDPVQLDYLRRRLASLSESWSAWVAGDVSRTSAVTQNMSSVGESLLTLSPQSDSLVRALSMAVTAALLPDAKPNAKPNASLAIEVATTILYLEAVYDDLDQAKEFMGARSNALAHRLSQVADGLAPDAVEPWMEALYRKRSERNSMGSVTSELRVTLFAVESALEKYRLDPSDSSILVLISGYLSQMYGVFSVLGLFQAANAVFKIREILDSHMANARRNHPIPIKVYEQIAGSVSTLGFLIDLLNYQIGIAKEMFFYDANSGEFRYLNGRGVGAPSVSASSRPESIPETIQKQNESGPSLPVLLTLRQAPSLEKDSEANQTTVESEQDDDRDILLIFLDEAKEVLEVGQNILRSSEGQREEPLQLHAFRRTFHTLKGGARMVGLEEFGEAAWSFEMLLTQWEDENRESTPQFWTLISQALEAFAVWTQCIAQNVSPPWTTEVFQTRANAMLKEQRLIPFDRVQRLLQIEHEAGNVALPLDKSGTEYFDSSQAADVTPSSVLLDESSNKFPEEFFEIFLSETSHWSLALLKEVRNWQSGQHAPNVDVAQLLAHSIRGNSAAVGIPAITELAQAIEETMERVKAHHTPVMVFVAEVLMAANLLHDLVRQSAYDRSPSLDIAILERLVELGKAGDLDGYAPNFKRIDAVDEGLVEEHCLTPETRTHNSVGRALGHTMSPTRASIIPPAITTESLEDDVQLDSQNSLDLELLPIFQEEGTELLPALGTALRRWSDEPLELEHRVSVLRLLHTLKGSSRLVGALRLGELTHRMESSIENVRSSRTSKTEIDRFLNSLID